MTGLDAVCSYATRAPKVTGIGAYRDPEIRRDARQGTHGRSEHPFPKLNGVG
jgi:hypothetical protein